MQKQGKRCKLPGNEDYPSIFDLPNSILADILARLPLEAIFITSCVSKNLFNFIFGDIHFAKFHSSKLQPHLLLHKLSFEKKKERISKDMYLVDPHKLFPEKELVESNYPYNFSLPYFKFRVPKEKSSRYDVNPNTPRRAFDIVNSCNGFVCLAAPYWGEPSIIWNPLTGEYIWLPKTKQKKCWRKNIYSGFGFSHVTNEYKVLRIFNNENGTTQAEINVVGSMEWRRIHGVPQFPTKAMRPIFLNSVLHWACLGGDHDKKDYMIVKFDFVREQFGELLLPPNFPTNNKLINHDLKIGVIQGYLSIFDTTYPEVAYDVWLMKEYGVQESWSLETLPRSGEHFLFFMSDGTISLVDYETSLSEVLNDLANGIQSTRWRDKVEGVAHTPSFMSFKNIMVGDKIKVLKVRSRSSLFGKEITENLDEAEETTVGLGGIFQWSKLPKPGTPLYMFPFDDFDWFAFNL